MSVAGVKAYKPYEVSEHLIESSFVKETFRIRVLQPIRLAGDSETFPVLYLTDGDDYFDGIVSLTKSLQVCGEVPRFIVVGIGYSESGNAEILRLRDLLTHEVRQNFLDVVNNLACSALITGITSIERVTKTTDSIEFLRFVGDELMPFLQARYPINAGDNNYFGYSAGATFGLHALFSRPQLFKRYILGSPALSYHGKNFGVELASKFVALAQPAEASVFMSVGELEEFKYPEVGFVTGHYGLAKYLCSEKIPGLRLTLRVFSQETHATAWTLAFCHGARELFGPAAQVEFWPG